MTWLYTGDVSLEYGGLYVNADPNDIRYDYIDAVRIIDLDSACGFDDAVLIERITIFGIQDKDKIKKVLDFCGMAVADLRGLGRDSIILLLSDAFSDYGYYDPVSDFTGPHSWIVLTDIDAEYTFDGWTAGCSRPSAPKH